MKADEVSCGILLAIFFVAVRGGNSAIYVLARHELPDMAIVAVSSLSTALVALIASLCFETVDWSKLSTPEEVKWTLIAGALSAVSVFAALRSLEFIPPWVVLSFVGLEPAFSVCGILILTTIVISEKNRHELFSQLPSDWWQFSAGLICVVVGTTLMMRATYIHTD